MAHIGTPNQPVGEFRLGLLGAGRLGQAIARTWFLRTGQASLVWSRSGPHVISSGETRITEAVWVAEWTGTLAARALMIAIPARAFHDLTKDNEQAMQFTGNVFNAAASLSRETVQRAFPRATVVHIAPFLIDGVNSIPMLVLRPTDLAASEWVKVEAEVAKFGDVEVVDDEATFAQLALLGAAWPAVVRAALQAAVSAGVQGLEDEAAIEVGRRIFFRAMQSFLANSGLEPESSDEIVTPGGITQSGLESLGDVTTLFESVFNRMQARTNELRA